MDCGPAALKCLLAGWEIPASYDRLREACQTDIDGTSIDTLEEVAVALGLDAEQVMLPADDLILPECGALPALLVVTSAMGATHFVVMWRTAGRWVQVMDPAVGRRWVPWKRLKEEIYLHQMVVPAAAWRQWAGSEENLEVLGARMRRLGIERKLRERQLSEAVADPEWRAIAALDAGIRLTASLCAAGALRRGREASAFLSTAVNRSFRSSGSSQSIPGDHWSVRPRSIRAEEAEEEVLLRGAVLLRVRGRRDRPDAAAPGVASEGPKILSTDVEKVVTDPADRSWGTFFGCLQRRGCGLLAPCWWRSV